MLGAGWLDGRGSSVNGTASAPSGKLDAAEDTRQLGGAAPRGLREFRLGKMKDASGNSSLGSRWGSAACLGACPGRPTLPFLPRADDDKLVEVMGRLLRGAFPELNSGSPASWSDLPSPGPCSVLQPGA